MLHCRMNLLKARSKHCDWTTLEENAGIVPNYFISTYLFLLDCTTLSLVKRPIYSIFRETGSTPTLVQDDIKLIGEPSPSVVRS